MDAKTIAQLIASGLNIAAALLPELEKIKAASGDAEMDAIYDDLVARSHAITDQLRRG